MDWRAFAARPVPWAAAVSREPLPDAARPGSGPVPAPAPEDPAGAAVRRCVIATRFLAFRNFAGETFPVAAPPEACTRLAARAADYAARRGLGPAFRLRDCSDAVLRMLRERHLIAQPPVPLPGRPGVKHLALGEGETTFAWMNEVEHLTWIRVTPGLPEVSEIPTLGAPPPEDEGARWARSPRWGFLASDPLRSGAGLAVQSLIHLPGLALARKLGQAHAALSALGAGFTPVTRVARGMPGSPGSTGDGALFRVTLPGGLAGSPKEIHRRFLGLIEPLLDWEAEAQARCLEKHRKRLEGQVRGSLEFLCGAESLTLASLEARLSWLRLGACLGLVPEGSPPFLEHLRTIAGSGHLEVSSGRVLGKEEEDFSRANVVKLSLERSRTRHGIR